ncbi:MAG: hypothetical protein IPO57_04765 [Rhodocyclales bacterium]|nr:hypothetical protein [Rhodocyclales bacterium]
MARRRRLRPELPSAAATPRGISFAGLLAFAAFFLWHSAKGGLQVATLALRPRPTSRRRCWNCHVSHPARHAC